MFSGLLPVALNQDPAVTAMFPAMRDPDRATMRGANPVPVNPDVAVAIPAVIAVDPDPTFMRRTVVGFDDRRGGRHANYDLRHSGDRNETDSKQQRQCSFFHRDFALHSKCRSTRIEEAFRAIISINTRVRNWLRSAERAAPGLTLSGWMLNFYTGWFRGEGFSRRGAKTLPRRWIWAPTPRNLSSMCS